MSEDPTFNIAPLVSMDLAQFAEMIADSTRDRDALLALIIAVDESLADLDFSTKLRDHLIAVCADEYETTGEDPEAETAHTLRSILNRAYEAGEEEIGEGEPL